MNINILRRKAVESELPIALHARLVLILTAGFSWVIYSEVFSRIAFLPDLFGQPFLTGQQVTMHTIDQGLGYARAELILSFVALGILYYMAWKAAHYIHNWVDWAIVLIAAFGFGFALLYMYPFGAADIFDNIVHARIFDFYGGNPFVNLIRQYPSDPFIPYVAWPNDPSAYGPLWELAAGMAIRLAGPDMLASILNLKLLPALFWALSLGVAGVMLLHSEKRPALPYMLLLAWNPLLLYEVWGNGHNDMMMAFFILAAAWMIMEKRYSLAVVSLVAGGLVKYIPILLLPIVGLIALRALPDNRRRLLFILSSGVLSIGLIVLAFSSFWVGIQTLSIDRRELMLSGTLPSAIYSILVDGTFHLDKISTAKTITSLLMWITVAYAFFEGFRAMSKPTWQSYVNHAFYVLMFYLLVTCPWFQQWYAIWPLVLLPFLEPQARNLALIFGFSVLGKQLWVDPWLYWSAVRSPLPAREIAFAVSNLIFGWLFSLHLLHEQWKQRPGFAFVLQGLPALPFAQAFRLEGMDGVPVTGASTSKVEEKE